VSVLYVNIMWAIVLFGILLWTTACVALNAALRRGMRNVGMVLTYGVGAWMLVDLPWREALVTWSVFAAIGGVLALVYELWARRRYRGTGRTPHPLFQLQGLLLWPAMIPDAVGLMFNEAGILPSDDRTEHMEHVEHVEPARPVP